LLLHWVCPVCYRIPTVNRMQPLSVNNLSLQLPDGTSLCESLSFSIQPGCVLALMGPSGSGKSSILGWITGTLDSRIKASGEIWLGDNDITSLPVEQRCLGLMLQQDYLFPHMSVAQNLKFGLRGESRVRRNDIVKQSLESAGLGGLGSRAPDTLSGGQRARVSLLRTLLSNPHALLLDEPFSRLDVNLRATIRSFTWQAAENLPVLLVTHDVADVPEHASTLLLSSLSESGDVKTDGVQNHAR